MAKSPSLPPRWRVALAAFGLVLLGALVATLTIYLLEATDQPDLRAWHRLDLDHEFAATSRTGSWTLEDYLDLEDRLFTEVAERLTQPGQAAGPLSRFNPESPTNPLHFQPNFNRTFERVPARIRGGALLLHGLTDSPYSVRPVAEILERAGYYCLALRIPGHGTLPAALTKSSWRDWRAAVDLGARSVRTRLDPEQPFIMVGYSNGAALALDHVLEALENESMSTPDRLVFLSPAFAVSSLAAVARWQDLVSRLPGLEKLAWTSVLKEHDPYKYNSFALNGARQIHELTQRVERRLRRLDSSGRTGELPPVLTIQSVVDATVPPISSLERLYLRLESKGSQLVLFDVNRAAESESFLRPEVDSLLQRATPGKALPFDVTLVTNRSATSRRLLERTRRAGGLERQIEELDLEWPPGVYSLSHVAIPFPPDDPIYGRGTSRYPFPFGRLEPRGERGALVLPMDLLMRLRFNPFFSYMEKRILAFVAE